jgi:hypothetical protein
MHLGSALVGILIGIVLGLWMGWLLGRSRRPVSADSRSSTYPSQVAAPAAAAPASPTQLPSTESAPPPPAEEPERPEPAPAGGGPIRLETSEPVARSDEALIAELLAVNRRLTQEAQTRLSRPPGEAGPDAAEPPPAPPPDTGAPRTPGVDLLEQSRRLTEDSKRRMARESDPESS